MPRTITTTVYQYSELSPQAQARARDWYRDASASDTDFADPIIEDFIALAGFFGWTVKMRDGGRTLRGAPVTQPCVYWALHSQGAGACFEGDWRARDVNTVKLREHAPQDAELHALADRMAAVAARFPEASATVTHSDRYYHSRSVDFDVDPGDECEDFADVPDGELASITRALMDWLYCAIDAECTYQSSDEHVAETIIANEYEFTADGLRSEL